MIMYPWKIKKLISIFLITALSVSNRPCFSKITGYLELVRKVQVTTDEDGGGVRAELTHSNGKFNIIYRNILRGDEGAFYAAILDSNLKLIERKLLYQSGPSGVTTDNQAVSDGTNNFVAMELVKKVMQPKCILSTSLNMMAILISCRDQLRFLATPNPQIAEHGDDASPFVDDNFLYLETHLNYSSNEDTKFRIRKFDKNLNPLPIGNQPYVDFTTPIIGGGNHHVASEIFVGENLYLVTQAISTSEQKHPDIYLFQYNVDWEYDNFYLAIAAEPEIPEMRPMGFQYSESKFYIVYSEFDFSAGSSSGGVVYLKIFDFDFNFIQKIAISDIAFFADHATVEIVGDRVYIAYWQALDAQQTGSNIFIKEYRWTNSSVTETTDNETNFLLLQNYPNPFNILTIFNFQLSTTSKVVLSIHNILGEKVRTLINGIKFAGKHSVCWYGKNDTDHPVSSGIYIYQAQIGNNFQQFKKLILIK